MFCTKGKIHITSPSSPSRVSDQDCYYAPDFVVRGLGEDPWAVDVRKQNHTVTLAPAKSTRTLHRSQSELAQVSRTQQEHTPVENFMTRNKPSATGEKSHSYAP